MQQNPAQYELPSATTNQGFENKEHTDKKQNKTKQNKHRGINYGVIFYVKGK